MSINPFSYGRPIDDIERFVGRRREIEQVYSRILSACESTSIVGESRTGKTSLLKAIAQPATQATFGLSAERYAFIYQDFQFLDSNTTPTRFWKRVLRSVKRAVGNRAEVVEEINYALKADTIDNFTLDDIFTFIDDEDLHIILLLDEFENVTRNDHFDSDFFGGLRALAIHHNLALITSSRQDLVELTHSTEVRSSPFFNIFATINLRTFTESEATELIDGYLQDTDVKFLLSELNVIFALAGYHPYFLQMTCYHLFAAYETGLDDEARPVYLVKQVRSEAAPLFQNYWRASSRSQQLLMIVLTMRELEGEDNNTIEELERFYPRTPQVITDLERRTLVTKNAGTLAYHLCSSELREWIADEIIGDVDNLRAWRDWQKDETLVGALPVNLQDLLSQVVRGLNPAYQDVFSNFLLDPDTAMPAIALVQQFVSRYEQYKETRPERNPAVKLADAAAPVGDTPKGLFARVSQQLAEREKDQPASQPPNRTGLPKVASPESSSPSQDTMTSTGRTLSRSRKRRSGVSAIALGGLLISGIVTKLDLDEADQEFVNGEIEWLFNATDNLLKITRNENDRNQPVAIEMPPDAERSSEADNRLLQNLDDDVLHLWKEEVETLLEWINSLLKTLNRLLNQEISRGSAAKSDLDLQNLIRSERIQLIQTVEQLAGLIKLAYGIYVTSPGQLVEIIEDM